MTYFYHCTSIHLEIGDVIDPGNWGKMLSLYGTIKNYDLRTLYRETVLENVRELRYPEKPSRLKSIFFCRNIEECIVFKNTARQRDNIYKVELLGDASLVHHAHWNRTQPLNWEHEKSIMDSMRDCALNYWDTCTPTADHGIYTECLIEAPIRVAKIESEITA